MIKKLIAGISAIVMSFCAFSSFVLADADYSITVKSGVTQTVSAGSYGEQYFIIDCADIANDAAILNSFQISLQLTNANIKSGYWRVNKTPKNVAFAGGLYYSEEIFGEETNYYITDMNDSNFVDNSDGTQTLNLLYENSLNPLRSKDGALIEVYVSPLDSNKDVTIKVLDETCVIVYASESDFTNNNGKSYYTNNDKTYKLAAGTSNVTEVSDTPTTYSITKADTTNGSFTVDKTTAAENDTVKITPTADEGFEVDTVTFNGTAATDNGDGTYSFTMPAQNVTVAVTFKAIQSPDTGFKAEAVESTGDDATDKDKAYAFVQKLDNISAGTSYWLYAVTENGKFKYNKKQISLPNMTEGAIALGVVIQYDSTATNLFNPADVTGFELSVN